MNIGTIIITATGTGSEAIGVIAITSMNSFESARNWAAFEPELRTKESLLIRNMWPRFGVIRRAVVSSGTVYTGLMSLQGNVDLQKLLGWRGASFSTRWYWLSGQDISAEHVGNIFTVSNIAGFPTVRMNELWFQQNFLSDRISIRVGQLGADSEFDLSTHSIVFLNGAFSWSPYLSNEHLQMEAQRIPWVHRRSG